MKIKFVFFFFSFLIAIHPIYAQVTQIKGFFNATANYSKNKVSFGFDEQDLFINATLNDRVSFLGETVFKYAPASPTEFGVSIERVIITYNLKGNNNLMIGKVHTPLNYWNDTYHHGRVFFPTIERPLLFGADIIPLHSVGLGLQGHDMGKLKFGYNFFVGNGLGSGEVSDNDKYKSVTAAVHIKPADRLKLGVSWYHDVISRGAEIHDKVVDWQVRQNLFSASVARFGKKLEILGESTAGVNHTDTTGTKTTIGSYIYVGYKLKDKFVPYLRFDNIHYQEGEIYYHKNNTSAFVAGLRYEINFLAVIKLEYQYQHSELNKNTDRITVQFAIGF